MREGPALASRVLRVGLLALVTTGLAPTGVVDAQEPAPGALDPHAVTELERSLRSRDRIRVLTADGRFELYDPRLEQSSLAFVRAEPAENLPNPLPLEALESVQVPRSRAARGALIGAFLGAALGLGVGLAAEQSDFFSEATQTSDVVLIAAGGAAGGALLGAAVGALIRGWKTVYPPEP